MNIPTNGLDPFTANRQCRRERHLDQIVNTAFRIKGSKNRKRKKYVYKAERANYRALLVAVAAEVAKRQATR